MKKQRRNSSLVGNRSGFITTDFLMSLTVAGGMIIVMFAFSTALSMLEIAQYIAYSTARAHAAGHKTQLRQEELAEAKFKSFFTDGTRFENLKPLLTNGWFEIDQKSLQIAGGGETRRNPAMLDEYRRSGDRMPPIGIRYKFSPKILEMNIPFLGAIRDDEEFSTNVVALILREPSSEECYKQLKFDPRFNAIKDLDPRTNSLFGQLGGPQPTEADYFEGEDNGC